MENEPQSYIRYNTKRIDYTVSDSELKILEDSGNNIWKDFSIALFALSIPCLINGMSELYSISPISLTASLVLNLAIGIPGFIISICFFIAWKKTKKKFKTTLNQIKNKPELPITYNTSSNKDEKNIIIYGDQNESRNNSSL